MYLRTILFLYIIFLPTHSFSQLHWQQADSLYLPLPPSIHIFKTIDSLDGSPFIAYYVSAKLKDKKLDFTAQAGSGKWATPDQYYRLEKFPLLLVNCTFFSTIARQNLSMVVKNGRLAAYNIVSLKGVGKDSALFYYPTRSALGIDKNRKADVAWIFTDSSHKKPYAYEFSPVIAKGDIENPQINDLSDVEWKWWNMKTAIGGGPMLIHDGVIMITNKEEQMFVGQEKQKQARTAMGYTNDGRLIILVIQGGVWTPGATLEQEAKIMKALGCYKALNLNGGSSSCMLVNGKETIAPSGNEGQKQLPAVFMIRLIIEASQ